MSIILIAWIYTHKGTEITQMVVKQKVPLKTGASLVAYNREYPIAHVRHE